MTRNGSRVVRTKARAHHIVAETAVPSRAIGMREMDLTPEEAVALEQRLAKPVSHPRRPPRDLPEANPAVLYKGVHQAQ